LARLLETQLVAHRPDDPGLLDHADDLAGLGQVVAQRLLAQHVEPSPGSGHREEQVLDQGGRHVHGLKPGERDELLELGGAQLEPGVLGQVLGPFGVP